METFPLPKDESKIDELQGDTEEELIPKVNNSKLFAIHMNKSTVISNKSTLPCCIHFSNYDYNDTKEELAYCVALICRLGQ
jgi:hypothetical protein